MHRRSRRHSQTLAKRMLDGASPDSGIDNVSQGEDHLHATLSPSQFDEETSNDADASLKLSVQKPKQRTKHACNECRKRKARVHPL